MTPPREPSRARGPSLSFQTRLTLTLLAAAIVPLGIFGLVLIASGTVDPQVGSRLLLFMFAVAVAVGILAGAAIGLDLVRPLRQISAAVERVSAGDLSQPIPIEGGDVLAQLAESHNRLAADAQRRNRQLGLILAAVEIGRAARRCRGAGRASRPRRADGLRLHLGRAALRRPRHHRSGGTDPGRLAADPGRASRR